MKIALSAILITLSIQLTKAQINIITGSIQDENGRFLHYVFVEDSKYKNVAFSDSLGNFTINLHADSKLRFELEGYRDSSISADKITQSAQIVLKSSANIPVETINLSIHTMLTENGLVAIRPKLNLVGSRYLFNTFSHGFFTDINDKQIYNPYYLFNYEKVAGLLLLTVDKKNVLQMIADNIKSFTLYNSADQRLDFEKVSGIDKRLFVQVIATGGKYRIYKLIKTKYVPADAQTVALGRTAGHEYDEYVDDADYYVLDVQSNQLQKLTLKKKSIKTDFAKEADKVNKFLTENSGDIDDSYLNSLGNYLND